MDQVGNKKQQYRPLTASKNVAKRLGQDTVLSISSSSSSSSSHKRERIPDSSSDSSEKEEEEKENKKKEETKKERKRKETSKSPMVIKQKSNNKRFLANSEEMLKEIIKLYEKWSSEEHKQRLIDNDNDPEKARLKESNALSFVARTSKMLLLSSTVYMESRRCFFPLATSKERFHFCSNDSEATELATKGLRKSISIINKYTKHDAWHDVIEDIIETLRYIGQKTPDVFDEEDRPHIKCLDEEWELYKTLLRKYNKYRSNKEIEQQYTSEHRMAHLLWNGDTSEERIQEARPKVRRYLPGDDEEIPDLLSSLDVFINQKLCFLDIQSNEYFQQVPLALFTTKLIIGLSDHFSTNQVFDRMVEARPSHSFPHLGLAFSSPTFDIAKEIFKSENALSTDKNIHFIDEAWLASIRKTMVHGISMAKTYLLHEVNTIHRRLDSYYIRLLRNMNLAKKEYEKEWNEMMEFMESDLMQEKNDDDSDDDKKVSSSDREKKIFETWSMAYLRYNQIKHQPKKTELIGCLTQCRLIDISLNIIHPETKLWSDCIDQLQALVYRYGNAIDDSYCAESNDTDQEFKELQHIRNHNKELLYLSSRQSRQKWSLWAQNIWERWYQERVILNTKETFQLMSRNVANTFKKACQSRQICDHQDWHNLNNNNSTKTKHQHNRKRKRSRIEEEEANEMIDLTTSSSDDSSSFEVSSPSSSSPSPSSSFGEISLIEDEKDEEMYKEKKVHQKEKKMNIETKEDDNEERVEIPNNDIQDDYWEPEIISKVHSKDLVHFIHFWNELSTRFINITLKVKEKELTIIPDEVARIYQACCEMLKRVLTADHCRLDLSTWFRSAYFICGWIIGMSGLLCTT